MNAHQRRIRCLVLAAALVALPGCYERVVGAKGMGAQGVNISQPNAPEDSVTKTTTQKRSLRINSPNSR